MGFPFGLPSKRKKKRRRRSVPTGKKEKRRAVPPPPPSPPHSPPPPRRRGLNPSLTPRQLGSRWPGSPPNSPRRPEHRQGMDRVWEGAGGFCRGCYEAGGMMLAKKAGSLNPLSTINRSDKAWVQTSCQSASKNVSQKLSCPSLQAKPKLQVKLTRWTAKPMSYHAMWRNRNLPQSFDPTIRRLTGHMHASGCCMVYCWEITSLPRVSRTAGENSLSRIYRLASWHLARHSSKPMIS